MSSMQFSSALNLHTPTLSDKILVWARSTGLFESPAELERCRLQKVNWFAGYLFPEEMPERLELIMKFFLCLFLLDDLLDIRMEPGMIEFLKSLKAGQSFHADARLQSLGSTLLLLHQAIQQENAFSGAKGEWDIAWFDYLEALQWEIQIKLYGTSPVLKEYRLYRPIASGAYLAMQFLRKKRAGLACEAELLEYTTVRYICLSNDLASYKKELAIGDVHNEVLILREDMGDEAPAWVQQEINSLRKRILLLAGEVWSQSCGCRDWIHSLLLLAGGSGAWTADTSRYKAYINGSSGSH
ncbi:hypothetical protein J2X69_000436 [Algoriphagus sp. 4150]|uniref:terpene synthase family protein n=1 Tax=Algoriphagus sp. 4150 TaxID=2817756 RepID=UPI002859ECD7|nr:terpene synthase family protein [Algoriphagus sp. 4150]MDR7128108.1 hypothetical protein [Algoriphagus sp. 4150]